MKKIGIFILMISVFGTTFFISNKLSAQVEPLEPLPTKPLTPIQSNQRNQTGNTNIPGGKGAIAGRIISTKAKEIEALENAGYVCPSFGQTIEIKKQITRKGVLKGPTSYFIASFIKSSYPITVDKAIIAYYSGTTNITCVHPLGATKTVVLNNILKYGVSKNPIR
jgi:hypothetical protein